MDTAPHPTVSRAVRLWIAALCLAVFAMVAIGGITRLTRSGLSIVEWQPIAGALPPLTDDQWHAAFTAYRQFPEYQQVNQGMTLNEFKGIFFWEYLHRLVGRLAGLVLAVPLLWLVLRRRITRPLLGRLSFALVLGGLQGVLGWYMVKSGLVNIPRVSHYRLAAHLSLAFFMFAFLFWTYLGLQPRLATARRDGKAPGSKLAVYAITGLVALQIVYGAFVAGMRAGYGYNTFPLMNGEIVPEGAWVLTPVWSNLFENPATIQFIHRTIAWLLVATIGTFCWRVRRSDASAPQKRAATLLAGAVVLQFSIGVATILTAVPVPLGALHQIGAFVLLTAAIYASHAFSEVDAQRRLDAVAQT